MRYAALLFPAIIGFLIGLLIALLRRNNQVFKYRTALSQRIFDANMATTREAFAQPDWISKSSKARQVCDARWKWLDAVGYHEMATKLWRPIDSFYGPMPTDDHEEWPEEIEDNHQ